MVFIDERKCARRASDVCSRVICGKGKANLFDLYHLADVETIEAPNTTTQTYKVVLPNYNYPNVLAICKKVCLVADPRESMQKNQYCHLKEIAKSGISGVS